MAMLQIGSVAFTPTGPHYDRLEHRLKAAVARHARFGRRDALQITGLGEEPVTISGTIYAEYFVGYSALAALRAMMSEPQMLVSGAGDIFGLFVILEVGTRQSYQDETGAPRKVEFDLKLDRYGDDGIGGGMSGADPSLPALLSGLSPATSAAGPTQDLSSLMGGIGLDAGNRTAGPSTGAVGLDVGSMAGAAGTAAASAAAIAARLW